VTKITAKFEEIQEKLSDQKEVIAHKARKTFIRHQ
jgi:hypothetical protein